jgi:type VI secretion system ImpB/VipA family protein
MITTPISSNGAVENKELPHRIVVLAPLSGQKRPEIGGHNSPPIRVTKSKRNDTTALMKKLKPTVALKRISNHFAPKTQVDLNLNFNSMQDFTPRGIEKQLETQMPQFKAVLDELRRCELLRTQLGNTSVGDDLKKKDLRDIITK